MFSALLVSSVVAMVSHSNSVGDFLPAALTAGFAAAVFLAGAGFAFGFTVLAFAAFAGAAALRGALLTGFLAGAVFLAGAFLPAAADALPAGLGAVLGAVFAAGLRGAMAVTPLEVLAEYGAKMHFFQVFFANGCCSAGGAAG